MDQHTGVTEGLQRTEIYAPSYPGGAADPTPRR